jgi:chromate transporter
MILALSVLFLASSPPLWVRGAGAGAGAAVAAVAVHAARGLVGPSIEHVRGERAHLARWIAYLLAGIAAAALIGPYLVLVLLACGLAELLVHRRSSQGRRGAPGSLAALAPTPVASGGIGALAWTALKVGALSFGGGFVILPLMQSDAVHVYHWMTNEQFLNAVALGQVTPGPVVATVAAVGYAAHGLAGGLLAALVAFVPSFAFVLLGGGRFQRLRQNGDARAFLDGAGPAAIGAIVGAAITLAAALQEGWQFAILGAAFAALLVLGRGVVQTLLGAALVGVVAAFAGAPLP